MLRVNNNYSYRKQKLIILFLIVLAGSGVFILGFKKSKASEMDKKNSCSTEVDSCNTNANFVDTNDKASTHFKNKSARKLSDSVDESTVARLRSTGSPTLAAKFPANTNVLIISTDDLSATAINPYIGPEHPMYDPKLNPEWQEFLSRSKVYHAVTPMTVCAPARAAFLSGRNPDTTKINTFERLLPQANNVSTLFMYARQIGYVSFVAGKVFHSNPPQRPQQQSADLEFLSGHLSEPRVADNPGNSECKGYMYCYGAASADNGIVKAMDKFFARMAAENKKFVAGAGLHRPHLTQKFPRVFLNGLKGDLPNYSLPELDAADYWHSLAYRDGRETAATYKINFGTYRRPNYQRIIQGARRDTTDLFRSVYNNAVADMRRNYYGSIRFTLKNVGRIVDSLKKYGLYENTVIIFLSDHGWLNGDYQIIGKNNLFPQARNVPFIVHYAGFDGMSIYPEVVSTLALYPTIIEILSGIHALRTFKDGSGYKLDGVSLVPTFYNPSIRVNDIAITQYPRCQPRGAVQVLDCMTGSAKSGSCDLPKITYMGYTLENTQYSFTAWWPYNDVRLGCSWPNWKGIPKELKNIVGGIWSQIDPERSGTLWSQKPVELQLYRMEDRKPISGNLAIKPNPENQALINRFVAEIRGSRLTI
jgi:arylsulfatase A-like enzyme